MMDRKRLTFEQADGAEPLPAQLQTRTVSPLMRALLFQVLHSRIESNKRVDRSYFRVNGWLKVILNDYWVRRMHIMPDEFNDKASFVTGWLKAIFADGDYAKVLGLVEFVLRHPQCPQHLAAQFDDALAEARSAYRVVDSDTIAPLADDAQRENVQRAFSDLAANQLAGARAHLRAAADELNMGNWGGSIRESVHAVEAVARMLEPSAQTLDPALAKLEKGGHIHSALRQGFGKLYGFSNDEKGIRHPLLDTPEAGVDETDALYMFGACAAFVSYLVGKGRSGGLIAANPPHVLP